MWKHFLHSFAITVILSGLLLGYMKADYSYDPYNIYNKIYYVWAKFVDILLILCILNPLKYYTRQWYVVICFYCVRLIWQLFAINDYATATRPSYIFILFLICVICIMVLFLITAGKELKRWLN